MGGNHNNMPGHHLFPGEEHTFYTCAACQTPGFGRRLRCGTCHHTAHEFCSSACQRTLAFFMHRQHALTLVPVPDAWRPAICDVCRDPIGGMFYCCRQCGFDAHPLCTKLREHIDGAPAHPHHRLSYRWFMGNHSSCAACGEACTHWRYRCGSCAVDYHLECIAGALPPRGADNVDGDRGYRHGGAPPPYNIPGYYGAPAFYNNRLGAFQVVMYIAQALGGLGNIMDFFTEFF